NLRNSPAQETSIGTMRVTRGAAARDAALATAVGKENIPAEPKSAKGSTKPTKRTQSKKVRTKETAAQPETVSAKSKAKSGSIPVAKAAPVRTSVKKRAQGKANTDYAAKEPTEDKQAITSKTLSAKSASNAVVPARTEDNEALRKPATTSKKRKRTPAPKPEEDPDELPHGLGKLWKPSDAAAQAEGDDISKPALEKAVKHEGADVSAVDHIGAAVTSTASDVKKESPSKKSPKKKANPYGLTPGVSPFPDWPHPTREECEKVNELLSSLHGKITPPEKIPPPSETVAGCGEVPCVLDALIRTYLSAATTGTNSSRAFQGLIDEYGKQTSGIGKGSVNWDAVRRSPVERVFKAIKSGGLADVKSKNIKAILDMVYEENQARRNAIMKANQEDNEALLPKGAESEGASGRAAEVARANSDVLSLDHLHSMSDTEVFNHLLQYPGVGVKTSSCVSLFCLHRPSFAVDTHVFRLCQWLGWVPPKADRDKTFMHCEVKVPDELKYSLHQLFIMHGKKCPRCRAITGESSEGWDKGCVIDHLVTRTGVRKGGESPVKAKKRKTGEGEKEEGTGEMEGDEEEEASDFKASPKKTKPKAKKAAKATPKKSPMNSNTNIIKKDATSPTRTQTSAQPNKLASNPKKHQRNSAADKNTSSS
ncbi:MAG: hypothetical protein LQ338_007712, partial [Usnochroma carphineum]